MVIEEKYDVSPWDGWNLMTPFVNEKRRAENVLPLLTVEQKQDHK